MTHRTAFGKHTEDTWPETLARTPILFRTPVTPEQVARVNAWLEQRIEAKITAALLEGELSKREVPAWPPARSRSGRT